MVNIVAFSGAAALAEAEESRPGGALRLPEAPAAEALRLPAMVPASSRSSRGDLGWWPTTARPKADLALVEGIRSGPTAFGRGVVTVAVLVALVVAPGGAERRGDLRAWLEEAVEGESTGSGCASAFEGFSALAGRTGTGRTGMDSRGSQTVLGLVVKEAALKRDLHDPD